MIEIYAEPFMAQALIAGCLAGALLGYLGLFIVLRRVVFLGAALPQITGLGIAAAVLFDQSALFWGLAASLLGIAAVSFTSKRGRIPSDTRVGIVYAVAAAGSILLLAHSAEGEGHILQMLSGEILGTSTEDLGILSGAFIVIALIHASCWKEFLFVSYDPEMASTIGLSLNFWDGLLFLTIGIAIGLSMQVCGAIVSFAFLIGPAVTALLLSRRWTVIIPCAATVGAISSFAGLTLSFFHELPSGPAIAACAMAPILIAGLWRFTRG